MRSYGTSVPVECHLTILLDLPASSAYTRKSQDPHVNDVQFLVRIQKGYADQAGRDPKRIQVIDATLPVEDVHSQVVKHVEAAMLKLGRGKDYTEEEG